MALIKIDGTDCPTCGKSAMRSPWVTANYERTRAFWIQETHWRDQDEQFKMIRVMDDAYRSPHLANWRLKLYLGYMLIMLKLFRKQV